MATTVHIAYTKPFTKKTYKQSNNTISMSKPVSRQNRLVPTEDMYSTIEYDKGRYGNRNYEDLLQDDICNILNELLINFTFNQYSTRELLIYFKRFYSLICHKNMPSFMVFRPNQSSIVRNTDRLLKMTYLNPYVVNLLCKTFIKELFIIGIHYMNNDVFETMLYHSKLMKIKTICNGIINESSTLTTKYDPMYEKVMSNINGGHGQGHIVPSILSNYDFFSLIYGIDLELIMTEHTIMFEFKSDIISEIYNESTIDTQATFIANLFMIAPFGYVRKLLEVIFGYKAFEYFDVKSENKKGLPYDRSKNMLPYTMETLTDRIKLKMMEVLMNSSKQNTIQLWTKCYDVTYYLYHKQL